MNERCETCKHWSYNGTPVWGECALAQVDFDGETLARAESTFDHNAWLSTHRTFGCVQHEPTTGERPSE